MVKILVVDDDPDILEAIQLLLETEKHIVHTDNGRTIYSCLQSFKPNLIILDVLLSGKDGRDVARILKNKTQTQHIPIIVLSAHPSAKESVKNCGVDEFIAKPFDINILLKKIHQLVN